MNELRVAMNAKERLRIYYKSVTVSKNALGICFKSSTIFGIGEFVAKVFISSKLWAEFRKDLRIARTYYELWDSVKSYHHHNRISD